MSSHYTVKMLQLKRPSPHIEENVPHMERMYTYSAHIEKMPP